MGSMWKKEKSFCDKLHHYIEDYPCRCDVAFVVGPEGELVKSLRAVLEVSSSQFQELLEETWQGNYNPDEDGIPLPDVNPRAFKIFLKLLLTDDVSVEALRTYFWTAEDILNLIGLSRRFGMVKLQQNLDMLAKLTFMSNISKFIRSDDFMRLSQRNLEMVLANDEIAMDEVDIFKTAVAWSENQCTKQGLEKSSDNIREILGNVLRQIRFPIMDFKDFGKIARGGNILTDEEQLEIFKFLSLEEDEVDGYDKSRINFNTMKRSSTFGSTISFLKNFKVVDEPSFICDGTKHTHYFQVDQRVKLNSIAFLGPVISDAFYEINIEIIRYNTNYSTYVCGRVQKKMFTRRRQLFYVIFDEPIYIDTTYTHTKEAWKEYYGIRYSLTGPNTQVMDIAGESMACNRFKLACEGVNFQFQWCNNPIAEFSFQKR